MSGILTNCRTQYTWDSSIYIFYLIEQHSKFLLHTLQVLYMSTICDSTNINTIIQFVPHKRGTQNEKIKWREEKWTWRSVIFMYIPCIFIVSYLFVPTNAYIYNIYFIYRVIRNDCRGFNNLSYTIHLRYEYIFFI